MLTPEQIVEVAIKDVYTPPQMIHGAVYADTNDRPFVVLFTDNFYWTPYLPIHENFANFDAHGKESWRRNCEAFGTRLLAPDIETYYRQKFKAEKETASPEPDADGWMPLECVPLGVEVEVQYFSEEFFRARTFDRSGNSVIVSNTGMPASEYLRWRYIKEKDQC